MRIRNDMILINISSPDKSSKLEIDKYKSHQHYTLNLARAIEWIIQNRTGNYEDETQFYINTKK